MRRRFAARCFPGRPVTPGFHCCGRGLCGGCVRLAASAASVKLRDALGGLEPGTGAGTVWRWRLPLLRDALWSDAPRATGDL